MSSFRLLEPISDAESAWEHGAFDADYDYDVYKNVIKPGKGYRPFDGQPPEDSPWRRWYDRAYASRTRLIQRGEWKLKCEQAEKREEYWKHKALKHYEKLEKMQKRIKMIIEALT